MVVGLDVSTNNLEQYTILWICGCAWEWEDFGFASSASILFVVAKDTPRGINGRCHVDNGDYLLVDSKDATHVRAWKLKSCCAKLGPCTCCRHVIGLALE
jgi:hypothetical protein